MMCFHTYASWMITLCLAVTIRAKKDIHPALVIAYSEDGTYELEDMHALQDKYTTEEQQRMYFSHLIICCPAKNQREIAINADSETKKTLFMVHVIVINEITDFKHVPRCHKKYEPAVFSDGGQEYSLGYEIRKRKKVGQTIIPSEREIPNTNSKSNFSVVKGLRLKYDVPKISAQWVIYEINKDRHSYGDVEPCTNYDLGSELFGDADIASYYNRQSSSYQTEDESVFKVPKSVSRKTPAKVKKLNDVLESASIDSKANLTPSSTVENSELQQPTTLQLLPPVENDVSSTPDETNLKFNALLKAVALHSALDSQLTSTIPNSDTDISTNQLPQATAKEFLPSVKKGAPSTSTTRLNPKPNSKKRRRSYLKMQQLAPRNHFDVESVKLLICTYLNVAPMWNTISEGVWSKVENCLQRVVDVLGNLLIISGTYGILQSPSFTDSTQFEDVYLDRDNQRIPVPRIFWKLVQYKVFPTSEPNVKDPLAFIYGMIIVTHNEVANMTEEICTNICEAAGWRDVINTENHTGITYCCDPRENDVLKRLGFDSTNTPGFRDILNLDAVVTEVTYDGKVKNFVNVNKIIN